MKFTCEKAQLVSAISVASRTVAQQSAISGLEGILVRAGVKVMLTGYNLETGITVSAVSYTHLDVYKRQGYGSIVPSAYPDIAAR